MIPIWLQYTFIAGMFLVAGGYLVKMFKESFMSKKGCNKDCDCTGKDISKK